MEITAVAEMSCWKAHFDSVCMESSVKIDTPNQGIWNFISLFYVINRVIRAIFISGNQWQKVGPSCKISTKKANGMKRVVKVLQSYNKQ